MSVKFIKTKLPGVLLIEPDIFRDPRGFFLETYQQKKYREAGLTGDFVQDNHSHSVRNTLRGLHYQLKHPQGKLVMALTGTILDIVVDIRKNSPTFGQWLGETLSGENKRQLYVPEGFAHGFCVLSETADVLYKCTDFYVPEDERGILWSDPQIGIDWPVKNPLLSNKDKELPSLAEAKERNLLP
jgi:dTDP-4-dehydrorhamnose 3,5-epimerase